MRYTHLLAAVSAFFALASADESITTNSTNTTRLTGTCYNLDGSEASGHIPCGTGETVNCCHKDDICMSNGLCYQQGDRSVLSRGTCTDEEWGEGCYAPCSEYNRNSTVTIVNAESGDEPEYCCGSVRTEADDENENDDGSLSCEFGDPFTIPTGAAIPSVARLSPTSTSTATSTPHSDSDDESEDKDKDEDEETSPSSSNSHKHTHTKMTTALAIALSIGIPLGLATICFVLWAIWERRRRQLRDVEARTLGSNGSVDLPGLHHRYGPIPSSSGRGTPNQSGFFVPQTQAQAQVQVGPQTQTQGAGVGVRSPTPTPPATSAQLQMQWAEVQWQSRDPEMRRASTASGTGTEWATPSQGSTST
ncbi:uncharacterized protein DSM5745_06935 [Aspergillus mulundensis]|uniref:Mid2 domain-containing protein n=1 Tax=Aspergillus mulundensis TaxID=1810919 RepID=A0A3D8RJP3_9EURO|nr:hypothetical protein DSM5745_06935 [Aspergillus mulundensis]RDW74273.1 hypothetical protein DSM5745_06935 [Aspergillus mulundensis]